MPSPATRSPSPALPKGRESLHAVFEGVLVALLPLGEGWDGASIGWYAPQATLTELRLHSPGLRAMPATLGNAPTNIATL